MMNRGPRAFPDRLPGDDMGHQRVRVPGAGGNRITACGFDEVVLQLGGERHDGLRTVHSQREMRREGLRLLGCAVGDEHDLGFDGGQAAQSFLRHPEGGATDRCGLSDVPGLTGLAQAGEERLGQPADFVFGHGHCPGS